MSDMFRFLVFLNGLSGNIHILILTMPSLPFIVHPTRTSPPPNPSSKLPVLASPLLRATCLLWPPRLAYFTPKIINSW